MDPNTAALAPADYADAATAVANGRYFTVPLSSLCGAHDPTCLTAADLVAALDAWRADLPAWPVVVTVAPGPAPACLFSVAADGTETAAVAFIGHQRPARHPGFTPAPFYAWPAGADLTGCRSADSMTGALVWALS